MVRATTRPDRPDAENAEKRLRQKALGNLSLHYKLGVSLLSDGLYEAAIREFRGVLERDPHHEKAFYLLALALTLSGKPEAAMELLRNRLQADPDCKPARDMLVAVAAETVRKSLPG